SSVDVTWHQKLGDGGDDYPVLAQCEGNTVYLVHKCDGSDTYSNTDHGTQAVHTPEYHHYTAPTETEDGNIEHWHCTTCGHNFEDEECTVEITGSVVLLHTTQLNDEIWYTSSTGQVVESYSQDFGDCNIISNTYENGIGIIKFDNAVTSIGRYAFYGCSSLTSINIPAAVTSIGLLAFSECHSLTSVNIPASVTSIESTAFEGCCSLISVTLNSNAIVSKTYSSNNSIEDIFGSQVTQYIIGTSVTSIGNSAFCDCKGLTSVTIPSSVTSIGEYAFRFCRGLTSVTFDGYRCENAIGSDAFFSVGSNVPATLTLPIEWAGPRPDDNGNWYRGRFSTVKYLTEEERVLGEMGEPCDDCPSVEVTKGTKTVKLYNPESVKFKKE
ncbi:MAG: leucine-rich repeat domain-containing protein, partial [bacterium]|nr:leucine-rich repeat domain-containing protein [Candidatus Limimorpha caballi]